MNTTPTPKAPCPLAVYSGECLMAVCGQPTGFGDVSGKPLFTGDIVQVYTVESLDGCEVLGYGGEGLTAVVSDEWTSFSDGNIERKGAPVSFFVMGIASVALDSPGCWRVRKVKDFADVVAGEKWPQYGFNYREAPDAALAAFSEVKS